MPFVPVSMLVLMIFCGIYAPTLDSYASVAPGLQCSLQRLREYQMRLQPRSCSWPVQWPFLPCRLFQPEYPLLHLVRSFAGEFDSDSCAGLVYILQDNWRGFMCPILFGFMRPYGDASHHVCCARTFGIVMCPSALNGGAASLPGG